MDVIKELAMDIPSAVAAQSAIAKQNIALSVIKQNAEASQQIANILDQTVQASDTRGGNVDISA